MAADEFKGLNENVQQKPTQTVFTVIVNGEITKIYGLEGDALKAMDDLFDLGVYASYREDKIN